VNGTATSGSDYTPISGRLTFLPGIRSQIIRVPIKGDTVVEPDETLLVRLSNPSSTATISRNQGTITIVNDDNPSVSPTISASNISIIEGNSGTSFATFTITRSGSLSSSSVISYVTASRSAMAYQDFTPVSGTLIFMPGETTKLLKVSIIGDTQVENDEYFGLLLSSTLNAKINTKEASCTIIDNDSSVSASTTYPRLTTRFTPAPLGSIALNGKSNHKVKLEPQVFSNSKLIQKRPAGRVAQHSLIKVVRNAIDPS